jgi:SpoVK/Ycf46/Vps4 family AAA+-type ATPase
MTESNPTVGARFAADLSALLRARSGLLWLPTREEQRAERLIAEAAAAASYEPIFWDCSAGFSDLAGREVPPGVVQVAEQAIGAIANSRKRAVWILRDVAPFLADPVTCRALRNAARSLPLRSREQAASIIVLTPRTEIPPELQGSATVLELALPDRQEVGAVLDAVLEALPPDVRKVAAPNGTRDAVIDAAVGLSESEVQAMLQKSLVQTRTLDPKVVANEKKRAISKARVLEWVDPIPAGLNAVGGLENLKTWLMARRAAFGPKARAYGLPAPKGALIVGVPGCGKSLVAKCISTAWGMPLLRLDLGALKSKWVGESEGNLRNALKTAESVSPCVVWLDEIEKALAGATSGSADGGVSADALGAILSWMQDRVGSVFVIATANDVASLPPELLRKGRFDEVWGVDLPVAEERSAIVGAALRQYGRTEKLDASAVAGATEGFTGAEIAALIPDALFVAFADGERPLRTADLVTAARGMVPLSKTAPEKIEKIRKWCAERARAASSTAVRETAGASPRLDL